MIDLSVPLIGPAADVLRSVRVLAKHRDRLAILAEGRPGCGKSHLCDLLALDLTSGHAGHRGPGRFAIERVNGQSLNVETVRGWRDYASFGNLFSKWTVKRIDELDQSSPGAQSELLTYLDYLPAHAAVLATTNEYARLRLISGGRLESRFVRVSVGSPSVEEAVKFLRSRFRIPKEVALQIAEGAVPEGCLAVEGVNMRTCMKDVQGYKAAKEAA
jgi:hypothetical protein